MVHRHGGEYPIARSHASEIPLLMRVLDPSTVGEAGYLLRSTKATTSLAKRSAYATFPLHGGRFQPSAGSRLWRGVATPSRRPGDEPPRGIPADGRRPSSEVGSGSSGGGQLGDVLFVEVEPLCISAAWPLRYGGGRPPAGVDEGWAAPAAPLAEARRRGHDHDDTLGPEPSQLAHGRPGGRLRGLRSANAPAHDRRRASTRREDRPARGHPGRPPGPGRAQASWDTPPLGRAGPTERRQVAPAFGSSARAADPEPRTEPLRRRGRRRSWVVRASGRPPGRARAPPEEPAPE